MVLFLVWMFLYTFIHFVIIVYIFSQDTVTHLTNCFEAVQKEYGISKLILK